MSIPFKRYVNIVSGVGGGQGVRQRDLILRLFTSNPLVSPDVVLEFTNAADVGTFFGTSSEEFRRASAYFGYVSPAISQPKRISFAAFSAGGNDATIIGNNDFKSIAAFQAISAGQLSINLGGTSYPVAGVDFTGALSLADVASTLQTAVRAADAALAQATVTIGSIGPSRFAIAVPSTSQTISAVATGSGANNLAAMMGLLEADGAVNITGSGPITAVGALTRSEGITNNFGSFVYMTALQLTDAVDVAAYNMAQNVMYQFHARVLAADAQAWSEALAGYSGTGLTLAPVSGEYPELLPCAILAATEYNKRGSVQNYMFKQMAGLTPSVGNSADADLYDGLRVNYYGETSTAGQKIQFYQRGTLMGTATAPVDMNVYGNEQWLKDYAGSQLMSLLLSVGRVPANNAGRAQIADTVQVAIDQALVNGTISIGKALTQAQKVFIATQTGDNLAWQTVESSGYILDVQIEPYTTTSGATEYKAVYTLIYSKDDAIRLVEGSHQLV